MLTENPHERKTLEKISNDYSNKLQTHSHKENSEDINKVVKLPWIPIIRPKLRKKFKKKNIKTIFTSGSNLRSLVQLKTSAIFGLVIG